MGKLVTYLIILIFIDILFLITGQLGTDSLTSLISTAIQDPSIITTSSFQGTLIGTAGLTGLIAAAGVIVGLFFSATNVALFIPMAIALSLLMGDFLTVYNILRAQNFVLATVIMAPIMFIFYLIIVEWLRNRD